MNGNLCPGAQEFLDNPDFFPELEEEVIALGGEHRAVKAAVEEELLLCDLFPQAHTTQKGKITLSSQAIDILQNQGAVEVFLAEEAAEPLIIEDEDS